MSGSHPVSTIFALATPAGRGALAVMRISGPRSAEALTSICLRKLPQPRRAVLRKLWAGADLLDEALVLWMPKPGSFTGEDSAELHLHGSGAVVAAVSDLLVGVGLQLAEPGEFTRRAFENGRLDLSQAEAVADLIHAESGTQRRQALAQLDGALSRRHEAWRDALLDALALLEAEVDFPDEETPDAAAAAVSPGIGQVMAEMQAAVADLHGERVREGFRIAIVGAPNVGKSSLLNAIAGRDAAIVMDVPGTTRDIVEVPINLAGQTLVLADTAGLRDARDPVEEEGVRRAREWAASADLRLGVVDLTRLETVKAVEGLLLEGDLIVFNKSDLVQAAVLPALLTGTVSVRAAAGVSDVQELKGALTRWLETQAGAREFPATTRRRHRALLQEAVQHLARNGRYLALGAELAAENVRLAIRALERVAGRSDPEAVLDRVFASFCIGK